VNLLPLEKALVAGYPLFPYGEACEAPVNLTLVFVLLNVIWLPVDGDSSSSQPEVH
jgi:hypothetical protein